MRRSIQNLLALFVILGGFLWLSAARLPAGEDSQTCLKTEPWVYCEGEVCCMDPESGSCWTDPDICEAYCDEHPESISCLG